MLLNPSRTPSLLRAIPGTRVLVESFGLIGATFSDPVDGARRWTITSVFAPLPGRAIGGLRVRVQDQKLFSSFCNQRDLELMLGLAEPGMTCPWLQERYPEIDSPDFFGPCMDEEDIRDDLFEHERRFRQEHEVLPYGAQFTRYMHLDDAVDVEELDMMLYDCDPGTGMGPDPRFETLDSRWTRVERNRVQWLTHGT